MNRDIGRELYANGWTQGVLFDPVALSVAFAPENPVSKLARAAAKKRLAADTGSADSHGIVSGIPPSTEHLVVVSQACDIVKPADVEPNVIAMPVFRTNNVRITGPAARNSSRYFLLDDSRGFVVDATLCAVIEKPLLATFTPEAGVTTDMTRRRFARWLARRFNRPTIPDDVVAAVVKPLLDNLRTMQRQGSLDIGMLDRVAEVRLRVANANLPYAFELLFIVDAAETREMDLALAPLLGEMSSWFVPEAAVLRAWYARALSDISVSDYLDSETLNLDEYSYAGGTIRGLTPPDAA
ncbi:MAG: hypothetical protein ACREM8_01920 [Vulcanimicrobiaceae bacterium]